MKNVAVLRFFCALEELEKSSTDVFQSPTGKRFTPSDLCMDDGRKRYDFPGLCMDDGGKSCDFPGVWGDN